MCSLVDSPAAFSVFYWLPLAPTPMGVKFPRLSRRGRRLTPSVNGPGE